jgi:hypothetical protein
VTAFYLDNDVSCDLGDLLTAAGHIVWHTRDLGLARANDAAQMLTAVDRGAVMVTHNAKDYTLIHQAWHLLGARWKINERHPGILILPHGGEMQLLQYLTDILQQNMPLEHECQRYFVSRGWQRVT